MSFFTYLNDFWNSITDATVGATTYTIEFFQQIGNAVGGAVGSILIQLFLPIIEVMMVLAYAGQYLLFIVTKMLSIPAFIFKFLVTYLQSITTVTVSNPWQNGVTDVLTQLPFWTTIGTVTSFAVIFLILSMSWKFAKQ